MGETTTDLRYDIEDTRTEMSGTLEAIASRDSQLDNVLHQLPPTLRNVNSTLVNVRGAVGDIRPTIRALQPAAPLVVLDEREHGLRLAERHLGRVAAHGDSQCAASLPRMAFSSCSKPPCSIEQCMPHSLGAFVSHHQRPARSSSPSPIARVQGAQPMLG